MRLSSILVSGWLFIALAGCAPTRQAPSSRSPLSPRAPEGPLPEAPAALLGDPPVNAAPDRRWPGLVEPEASPHPHHHAHHDMGASPTEGGDAQP